MHSVIAKQLIAIVMMVVVALSGTTLSSAAKGNCLIDVPVVATHAIDSHCVKSSPVEEAAEHTEASCSPYASAGASAISCSIAIHSPGWLISQPYLQLFLERLDKPPRLLLPL